MSHLPRYQRYRPKIYVRPIAISWWVHRWVHMRFILRELTSLFVAFYVIALLLHVRAIGAGPEAYESFQALLATPGSIALHAIALAMALFHSISWFRLAPKAMVIKLGDRRVPPWLIVASNFAAWGVASALLAWILLAA